MLHFKNFTITKFKHRLKEELMSVIVLAIYFAIFFSALTYLKFSILEKVDIAYTTYSLCIVRALVCAKFMTIAQKLYPIHVKNGQPLFIHILNRSCIYVLIVNLHIMIEEIILAKIHGKHILSSITGIAPGTINQFMALEILYLLMLIPYVTYFSIGQSLDKGKLRMMVFGIH